MAIKNAKSLTIKQIEDLIKERVPVYMDKGNYEYAAYLLEHMKKLSAFAESLQFLVEVKR